MISTTEDYTTAYGGASLTLRAYLQYVSGTNPLEIPGGRLRVDVIDATAFPLEVFIWEVYYSTLLQRGAVSSTRPVCMAKTGDLTLPTAAYDGVPDSGALPYFRKSYLDMQINSPDILLDTWARVKEDVAALVRTTMQLGGPQEE